MVRLLITFITTFSVLIQIYAQVPSALASNGGKAVAVVNNFDAVFTQTDLNNATYKVTQSVTILDKQGEAYGYFYTYGDKFRELKNFSGVVKNVSGAVIRKVGKKDLTISSLSEQMASDAYSIVYECKSPTYPYTVEYTYEERWKNGILAYPPFTPVEGYMQSVSNANYTIELPADMSLRYNTNFDCRIKDEKIGDKHIYTFSVQDMGYIEKEPLSPLFREISPRVLIAPADFCYDSHCGNMSDWKSYGLWVNGLLKDRDILPPPVTEKIKDLVKGAKDDREKVEILYKYLQDNSRYVSIQLGIGGFQPMEASLVSKSNYGDCKGLSNLMKAYLNVIGIPSNYCEISMKKGKYLYGNFANISQTDHAILLVPLPNDSIWLECTSQRLPFGYVHDDIAGHDALVVTENGGKLCRLPVYADSLNRKQSVLTINLSEDGSAKGEAILVENLHGYASNVYRMTSKDRKDVVTYLNRNLKFPKIQFNQINAVENKSSLPSCTLTVGFDAGEFANRTGTRLFIPVCPLNKNEFNVFSSKDRNLDIQVNNGYSQADTVIYNLPDGYVIESSPKDVSVKTPYGTLETSVRQDGNQVIYSQNIDVYTGKYDKEEYSQYKNFYTQITNASKRRFVLKKAE